MSYKILLLRLRGRAAYIEDDEDILKDSLLKCGRVAVDDTKGKLIGQ